MTTLDPQCFAVLSAGRLHVDGLEFEQARGVGDGQGSLVCCSPWGLKELDTTERLNNNKGLAYFPLLVQSSAVRLVVEGEWLA